MVRNPPASAGEEGLIPGLERSPAGRNGNPLQYSCVENSMEGGKPVGYSPWGLKEGDTTAHSAHTVGKILTHPKKRRVGPCRPTSVLVPGEDGNILPLKFQLKFHFVVFYFLKVENQWQLHSLASTCFSFSKRGRSYPCVFF